MQKGTVQPQLVEYRNTKLDTSRLNVAYIPAVTAKTCFQILACSLQPISLDRRHCECLVQAQVFLSVQDS